SKNTMPSCVSFTSTETLIGESARKRENANSANNADSVNTITGVKRLMGRTFDDPEVQKEVERRPYKILEGLSGRVNIQVTQRDQVKTFLPQEISAL
ncbi:heat shock protein 70, partial [Aphelenchoides avenae]